MACAQSAKSHEIGLPFLQYFSKDDYKAHPNNLAVIQDKRGVVYVANKEGLLEFDGHRWRVIPIDYQGGVFSLCMTERGRVYIGGQGEMGYLKPDTVGRLVYQTLRNFLPEPYANFAQVWSCHAIGGKVYFQTDNYLAEWDEITQKFQFWKPITNFFLSWRIGDRLFVHDKMVGLHELKNNALQLVPMGEQLAGQRLLTLLPFGKDSLLVGTDPGGFMIYTTAGFVPWQTQGDDFIRRNQLYHAAALTSGQFAVGTLYGGVIVLDHSGKVVQVLNKGSGLVSPEVHFIYQDFEGGLWLALDNGVVRVEAPALLSSFGRVQPGVPSSLDGTVVSVVRHLGELYVATSLGVYKRQSFDFDNQFTAADFRPVEGIGRVQASRLMSAGPYLLVATREGVYQIVNDMAQLISNGYAKILYQSKFDTSRVFIGLDYGLASIRHHAGGWLNEGSIAGFRAEVNSLAEDSTGTLWAGTLQDGLVSLRFRDSNRMQPTIAVFDTSVSGLLSMKENKVFRIGGRLFFDINQIGLCQFMANERKFVPYMPFGAQFADGSRAITNVVEDEKGVVYISTLEKLRANAHEVYRLTPAGGRQYRTERLRFDRFLKFLPEIIYPEANGVVWIGSASGMIRYDSRVAKNYEQPFRALIRLVTVNVKQALYGGSYFEADGQLLLEQPESMIRTLDYVRGNTFRFHCAAASYDEPGLTEFQYLLEGNDNKWSEWTHEPFKEYTNLLEGTYRFRVRARNAHLQVSEVAVYEFHIRPPIYRTVWAWLLYALLGVGLLYSIYQYRHQALIARKNELERLVKDRTFELEMAKDQAEIQNQLLRNQKQKLEENEAELTRQKNQLSIRNFMLQEQTEKLERQKSEIEAQKQSLERANSEIMLAKAELENAYEEIRATNENLAATNEELEQKNRQLIVERAEKLQAQKMAGLGEITSIVAHEINTPLSSIIGSLNNVQQSLASVIQELPAQVATLTEASLTEFWALIEIYRSNPPTLTSREERGQQRTLEAWFEGLGYDRPEDAALQVVRVGIGGRAQEFESLFALAREHEDLFELIVRLGSTWRQLFAMNASADRAKLIVTSLQSYVKQADDEGKAVPTNVLETLRLVLTLYDYYISRGIELKLDLADDLPLIEGYPHLLKQAWTNLIMSSVYAMNFKGVLEISAESDEGGITLTLRDSGPQITPDRLEQLFKAEANARETSPPVSLWICYNVFVEQHGGEITVNSDGEHTTYAIRLPLS